MIGNIRKTNKGCFFGDQTCSGPYAASNATVCDECAEFHDAHPNRACKCFDCQNGMQFKPKTMMN